MFKKGQILLLLIALFSVSLLSAQSEFTGLINPSFAVKVQNETPWTFSFGIANRDVIYQNNSFDFEEKYIELNHYTHYQIKGKHKIGMGIRWFTDEFSFKTHPKETRLLEEYTFSHQSNTFSFAHRLRLSQRFQSHFTQRIRYRFSVEFPLSSSSTNGNTSLSIKAEPVWEISSYKKPTFGQRLSTTIHTPIFSNLSGAFGFEYRYRNYTQNPYTQLYLLSGLKLSL